MVSARFRAQSGISPDRYAYATCAKDTIRLGLSRIQFWRSSLATGALADRNLLAIEVEHKQADRRGQVAAAPPLRIDRGDELRQGHTVRSRALLEALPEFIFEAHAGAMAIDKDGTFDDH